MNYYAIRLGGELTRLGGPGTLHRFKSKQERDYFVETRSFSEPIPANHLWVKQAKWAIQNWVKERKGRKFPSNWESWPILFVDYDITEDQYR